MHQRLTHVQWLFLDPAVLFNENDSDRESRRQIAAALTKRGRPIGQEQVERAWMQAISSPRPSHPLLATIQLLAPDATTASAITDEVLRQRRAIDTLFAGVQLALGSLQREFSLGLIGPYRLPGVRPLLQRFHLAFPVVALSDEQHLSHQLLPAAKPDPALFVWALRRAGCPANRAAFATDRVDLGVLPAKATGMTTIWLRVTNFKLRHPRSASEQPDLTLGSLSELTRSGQ